MIPLRSTERVYSPAVVTISLIVANLLIFLYQFSLEGRQSDLFILTHGIVPDRLSYPSLVTSMFLHGGWLHLLGNMWFLWIYGRNVEDIMGSGRFFAFYMVCGLIAAAVHIFFNPYSRVPTVGASGAIAGVMGAYLIRFPHARIITLVPVFVFITTLELPAVLLLVYWFIIQFFSGFMAIGHSQVSSGGIAWFAHVGGFVAGMLLVRLVGTRRHYGDWNW
jgi:membrane associated rhomboid family serine protease